MKAQMGDPGNTAPGQTPGESVVRRSRLLMKVEMGDLRQQGAPTSGERLATIKKPFRKHSAR